MNRRARWLGLLLCCAACVSAPTLPLRFVSGEGLVYPDAARAAGTEGFVVVSYDVTVEGHVINARVAQAEPPGVFDEAAIATVSAWRFYAPVVKGEVRAAPDLRSRVEFKLGEGEEYAR